MKKREMTKSTRHFIAAVAPRLARSVLASAFQARPPGCTLLDRRPEHFRSCDHHFASWELLEEGQEPFALAEMTCKKEADVH